MLAYLGGETAGGDQAMEAGTTHWASPHTLATNASGFTALPGGWREIQGTFYELYNGAYFWTSTLDSGQFAFAYFMEGSHSFLSQNNFYRKTGFSIRCIKD